MDAIHDASIGHDGAREEAGPRLATDVVQFGQEIGRVLSDGRIIGRAEPYAKVFPSSREVKRAVGVIAWAVLEDIALDARIDDRGRLVANTNVCRIADNLGLSKNTVTDHMARLRDHGFVLHEEQREVQSGRYVTSWYVLDPSACIERFTTTPSPRADRLEGRSEPCPNPRDTVPADPCPTSWDTEVEEPCPVSWDTAEDATVSQSTGHRDLGQCIRGVALEELQEQEQNTAREEPTAPDVVEQLVGLGVDAAAAKQLTRDHGHDLIQAALSALPAGKVRNPAGWLVRAVRDGWAAEALERQQRQERLSPRIPDYQPPSVEPDDLAHEAWAAFAVTVLDDHTLADAVGKVTSPVPGLGRRSVPIAIGELGTWAAGAFKAATSGSLREALIDAVETAVPTPMDPHLSCVELPDVDVPSDWQTRLGEAIRTADNGRRIGHDLQAAR